ncbi:MAG TPA: hypothetical protein VI819_05645 [Patescibacteria group bacterium]|nr:hypothetical protein [Patescibacteria group bacterium]
MKKKFLYPAFILTFVTLLTLYGGSKVLADDVDGYPPIVQAIADKFGVDESDVTEVFDQERVRIQDQRQALYEQRLSEAVAAGVITQEQSQSISDKHKEYVAEMEAIKLQHRDEMQKWIGDQGIDQDKLMQYIGFGSGGNKMHMGMGSF